MAVGLGVDGVRSADHRSSRATRVVDAVDRRARRCGDRQPGARRSQGESDGNCGCGDPGRGRRRDLRHRDRCISHRVARAAPIRRRLRHVRSMVGASAPCRRALGARDRGASGLGSRVHCVRDFCGAGHARRIGARRTAATSRARATVEGLRRDRAIRSSRRLLEFFRRKGALLVLLFVLLHKIGDTLAESDLPLAVRGPALHERRNRDLRRRLRFLGLSRGYFHRRHFVRAHGHEALGACSAWC